MTTRRTMTRRTRATPGTTAAFTLIELMIAVALVLVLILGVNEVFRLTGQTIGAGQAISSALRDQRAFQQTATADFAAIAPDAPCFIIQNRAVPAFRSAADKATNQGLTFGVGNDASNSPEYQDLDGDHKSSSQGEQASPAIPSSRMHRIDTLTMFVRRPQARATGNIGKSGFLGFAPNTSAEYSETLGNTTAGEAMVTYGHLRVANDSFGGASGVRSPDLFFDPGEANDTSVTPNVKNDNNIYASQWYLGRSQLLMTPMLFSKAGATQAYPGETAFVPDTPTSTTTATERAKLLTPLSMQSRIVAYASPTAAVPVLDPNSSSYPPTTFATPAHWSTSVTAAAWESKLDLSLGSIGYFSRRFAQYRLLNPDPDPASATPYGGNWPWFVPGQSNHTAGYDHYSLNALARQPQPTLVYRGSAVPFATRSPNVPDPLGQTLAQTSPILLPRVTQFIVEYAGDFISQDNAQVAAGGPNPNYGNALHYPQGAQPDGQIDYVVFRGQKRIRWYGLPRYTGSGYIATSGPYVGPVVGGTAAPPTSVTTTLGQTSNTYGILNMPDVIPLSDVLSYIGTNSATFITSPTANQRQFAPFERVIMASDPAIATSDFRSANAQRAVQRSNWLAPQANYANLNTAAPLLTADRANYICAWAGGGPKMIRITITLEDANPKNLSGGQTYEYIYNLPY